MKQRGVWWQLLAVLAMIAFFFMLLFYEDNKYHTPPPYGKSGIINLKEADLERRNPIFLIDGWLLTDERVTDKPTYIGEFSNLQRGDLAVSPHGQARYQLTLHYDGTERIVFRVQDSAEWDAAYSGNGQWADYVFADGGRAHPGCGDFVQTGILQRNVFSAGVGHG